MLNQTQTLHTQPTTPSQTQTAHEIRIIRASEAVKRLGVGKTTFHDWQNPHSKRYRPDFPPKVRLGENSTGYLEHEITAFILKLAGRE